MTTAKNSRQQYWDALLVAGESGTFEECGPPLSWEERLNSMDFATLELRVAGTNRELLDRFASMTGRRS